MGDSTPNNDKLQAEVACTLSTAGASTGRVYVVVHDARVFLYGLAYTLSERSRLEALALAVPGVSSVENYLHVNLFA